MKELHDRIIKHGTEYKDFRSLAQVVKYNERELASYFQHHATKEQINEHYKRIKGVTEWAL